MSKLNVVIDLNSESPTFDFAQVEDDRTMELEVCFGARKVGDYDNLSFGYNVTDDTGASVVEVTKPNNVTYIRSDQEFIDYHVLEYTPNIGDDETFNYNISAWCEDAGQRYEQTHSFQLTIPGIVDPYPDGPDATPESVGKAG